MAAKPEAKEVDIVHAWVNVRQVLFGKQKIDILRLIGWAFS